jgi:8-oxo-dGTP pyrophosphatase MutT (NUDIX family)
MKQRFMLIPAVYLLFRRGDELLCILRARTGYADGNYSLPAGHVDGGEPAAVAVAREAMEEVGVRVDLKHLRLVHAQHRVSAEGGSERMNLFFEVPTWEGEFVNNEPDKCQEIRWLNIHKLPNNMAPEVVLMLERVAAGHAYSDLGFDV